MFGHVKNRLAILLLALSLFGGVAIVGVENAAAYSIVRTPQDSCFFANNGHECTHYYCGNPYGTVYVYINQGYFDWNWNYLYTVTSILGIAQNCTPGQYAYYVF